MPTPHARSGRDIAVNSVSVPDGTWSGLDKSPHPLAFVAAEGIDGALHEHARRESSFRCEVMGLGRFQKEGLVEDLVTGRVWRSAADEGKYLRGTGLAPAPLMHWAAGLHGDVTSRIAGLAAAEKAPLASLEVTASQGFASQGSFARGQAVGLVFDLAWEFRVVTDEPANRIASIVDRALRSSPANAALTTGKEGTFALYANGRAIPVIGIPQSQADAQTDPFRRHASRPAPVNGDIVTNTVLTTRPGTDSTTIASDDQSGAIGWHVQAKGHYDFESGTVTTTVGFPELATSETWALVSDCTNRQAPSPLSYFSIGTAFCYHTQLCRYADVRRLGISLPRLVQASIFSSDNGEAEARAFDTHLFLNGTIDDGQATSLLIAAANTCYAHRALSVDVTAGHATYTEPIPCSNRR